jgi:heterodisulfide reductase subunit B
VLADLRKEAVGRHVVHRLDGLKVACYYGCQISRPFGDIDDPEFPQAMDHLMGWLGATPVDFRLKTRCCGGMLMTTAADVGLDLSGKILREAVKAGADCISTACPLCHVNLEAYQSKINSRTGGDCRIPVLYFTQIMGRALGLGSKELALGDSLTHVDHVMCAKGSAA